jgi:hypothetical protein
LRAIKYILIAILPHVQKIVLTSLFYGPAI